MELVRTYWKGNMAMSFWQRIKSAFLGAMVGVLVPCLAFGQATLLPNAKQQYLNDAAQPVANGQVFYYVPSTSTLKTVWSDAAKTTPLTNPVILDAAGRPQPTGQIYGDGSYRQKVVDQDNNTIWDAVTTSTGSGGSATVAATEGVMVGTIIAWTNPVLPAKYLYTAGQAISRTTYSNLFTAITYQATILCQFGVATITVPTSISDVVPIGAPVEASCFAPGTTVIAKSSGTLTMSTNATVTLSVTATILPWGNGNGATTFNVPDLRGRSLFGRNNMLGSPSSTLSSLYYVNGVTGVNPNAVGAVGGGQSFTLLTSNMPSHNHPITDPGHTHLEQGSPAGGASNHVFVPTNGTSGVTTVTSDSTSSATTGISTVAVGGGVAVSATVGSGGSGYTNGVQLATVSAGTCSTSPTFNVTVVAGAITNPVLVTPGLCSVVPGNPAGLVISGGGSGGTLNVVYSSAPISIVPPAVTTDYIIKALPDDSPTTPGVTSLGGMTGAIACGTNVTCTGNTISVNISNLTVLAPSALATAAVLPNTPTYNNGTAGVGATLTSATNTTLTVDGTAAPLNTVVLVKNQASAFQNGVYTVTQAGSGAAPWILTRATYFDQAAEMRAGSYTFITSGSTNIRTAWTLQSVVTTVGTDALTFVLFSTLPSGTVTSAQVSAGTGISVSGTCTITVSGNCTVSRLFTNARLQVTATAPANTGSTTAVMSGFGNVCTFTPTLNGAADISITFASFNNTGGNTGTYDIRYGTGAAPAANVAVTGTQAIPAQVDSFTTANAQSIKTLRAYITGLSIGVAVWFDLSRFTSANTLTIAANPTCTAIEQ